MLRFGNITEVDAGKGYARVTFTDDGIVSDWLQVCVMGAISNKFTHTFNINEQVACLMDENSEEGVIIGALYNDSTAPNGAGEGVFRVKFEDDSVIEYNKNTNNYNLDIKGNVTIKGVNVDVTASGNANITASGIAKIQAPSIQLNGLVTTTGAVAVGGGITVGGTITAPGGGAISGNIEVTGSLKASGNIETTSDVKAGTISLKTHVHGGVQTGSGSTSTPTL